MGNYIKELFDYNKDEDGVINIDGTEITSPQELKDYISNEFISTMEWDKIYEFDLEEFAYEIANYNLDLILERVLELSNYVESLVEGYPPLFALTRTIILRYLNSIKKLIANERSDNGNI